MDTSKLGQNVLQVSAGRVSFAVELNLFFLTRHCCQMILASTWLTPFTIPPTDVVLRKLWRYKPVVFCRTSLHREQLSGPRSRRHSVFSETIVRFSTSGDPFVDRVSFSVEPTYSATEPHGGSWSTEDIAPRMSRITSLTCDAEVSRISTAVAADTDSEIDEIGPVFAREDSMESEGSRRLRSRISQSFEEEEEEEPSLTEVSQLASFSTL